MTIYNFDKKTINRRPTTIMFSHNDMDGVGCGIIHKSVYGREAETHYCGYHNVDEKITKRISELEATGERPKIIISDLGIKPETAELVDMYEGEKVLLDHHKSNEWISDTFDWAVIDTGQCGTLLVFFHLIGSTFKSKYYEFAKIIDDYDRWIHDNPQSLQMNRLFFILGRERFEHRALELKRPQDIYGTAVTLLEVEDERIENYISKIERNVQVTTGMDDKRFGVAFVDQYQSEAGHELIERLNLDVIAMIDANSLKVSLRSMDDFDVGEIAERLGGGGHKNAAGVNFRIPDSLMKRHNKMAEAHTRIKSATDCIVGKVMAEHYAIETAELSEMFNEKGAE